MCQSRVSRCHKQEARVAAAAEPVRRKCALVITCERASPRGRREEQREEQREERRDGDGDVYVDRFPRRVRIWDFWDALLVAAQRDACPRGRSSPPGLDAIATSRLSLPLSLYLSLSFSLPSITIASARGMASIKFSRTPAIEAERSLATSRIAMVYAFYRSADSRGERTLFNKRHALRELPHWPAVCAWLPAEKPRLAASLPHHLLPTECYTSRGTCESQLLEDPFGGSILHHLPAAPRGRRRPVVRRWCACRSTVITRLWSKMCDQERLQKNNI